LVPKFGFSFGENVPFRHLQLVDPGWKGKIKSAPCSCWNCFDSRELLFVFLLQPALTIFLPSTGEIE
jgi:hypothetical protein